MFLPQGKQSSVINVFRNHRRPQTSCATDNTSICIAYASLSREMQASLTQQIRTNCKLPAWVWPMQCAQDDLHVMQIARTLACFLFQSELLALPVKRRLVDTEHARGLGKVGKAFDQGTNVGIFDFLQGNKGADCGKIFSARLVCIAA
jgi:hypothetical protein